LANYFLDRTNKNADLAGTWTFTNASTAVSGSGGNAQTLGLGAGDYIKPTGTDEWYKIASVGGENTITLAYNFVQATQTSVVANYADVSVNDGTTAAKAFVNLNQFQTDTVRSAGDKCYVRRNQTHLHMAVNLTQDENGTITSPIEVLADDGTGWSGEEGATRPTLNFSTGDKNLLTSKNYWTYRYLILNGGASAYGNAQLGGIGVWFYNTRFQNCTGGGYAAVFLFGGREYYFENCDWSGNSNKSVNNYQASLAKFKNCTWNNNATCLDNPNGGTIILIDCSFGQTTGNSGANLTCGYLCTSYVYNTIFESASTDIVVNAALGVIYSEDHNGVKGDNRAWYYGGSVIKNTATVRTGGATSSALATPANTMGLSFYKFQIFEACLYAPATQKTYSLYMLGNGWSTLPTNTELYIEDEYFDEAGTAHKATVKSTQVLSANDVWTQFSVTVTPAAEGLLRIRAYLTKYQANAYVYVDIKPVVT
jgi:hypothetical protein